MARIHATTRKSTLALRRRKRFLVSQIKIFPDSLRASLVERFSRCGKANCACHHGGDKHGPFYYLTQCLAAGKMNKFLLKTPAQRQIAQAGIEHYHGGDKHGPFYYLTQCLAAGKMNKFLLKTPAQRQIAQAGIEHYHQFQEQVEELSQINAELLRRGESLTGE